MQALLPRSAWEPVELELAPTQVAELVQALELVTHCIVLKLQKARCRSLGTVTI